ALLAYQLAAEHLRAAAEKLDASRGSVQARTLEQAEAAKFQAVAAHELPPLREKEAEAGAALHRLVVARQALEADEQRAKERIAELQRHIEQFGRDLERERALIQDAAEVADRLEEERAELQGGDARDAERETEAQARLNEIEAALAATEADLSSAQEQLAGVNAKRAALEAALRDENQRVARFEAELTRIETEFALIAGQGGGAEEVERLAKAVEQAAQDMRGAEETAHEAEAAYRQAREAETVARAPLEQAALRAQRLETETRTLDHLLQTGSGGLWAPVVESMTVEKGYETALGAALGDDLDASAEDSAPAHWSTTSGEGDPALPNGVRALGERVDAPPALRRRLAQIGVVLRAEGESLRKLLKPGQRLVSKEGDLWRWDGFTQAAEAPTAAARRLAEKNRLADLRVEAAAARETADALAEELTAAREAAKEAAKADVAARDAQRRDRALMEEARERHSTAERRQAQIAQRLSALQEAKAQTLANRDEAAQKRAGVTQALDDLEEPAFLAGALENLRGRAMAERAQAGEARAALASLRHERAARDARLAAIARETASWAQRRDRAQDRIGEIEERLATAQEEHARLSDAPD
ncbi:MAG: chromosome segregation protein SMC, partial [Alphaproteobacteria bacterium]|nr:chromosome segregation protein SMC [Alphaproteobacteria bacterium]